MADKIQKARDYGVGLPARRAAVSLLTAILTKGQPLDDALVNSPASREMLSMAERDRGLARAIVSTAIRHKGQLDAVLDAFIDKPLPKSSGPLREILLSAACQLLFLNTPAHAAIDLAVRQAKQDRNARHFDRLANAVLRRVASEGPALVKAQNGPRLNTPDWLWQRWVKSYGEETAQRIAQANMAGAALDLTVKQDPAAWAKRLNGIALDTGSVRLVSPGRIESLEGFEEGAWWVQDAAAALPARLLGDIAGKHVADLCAAPGGKSAQLVLGQARVTCVDSSKRRLVRLNENMARLGLDVTTVMADAAKWMPDEPFDAVLLDAPCTGTGTLRRHPDIAHLKGLKDLKKLAALQERLLRHAITILRPGGVLVYCTCSLEPEEGELQIKRLLDDNSHISIDPIGPDEVYGHDSWINEEGYLRTLPFDLVSDAPESSGIDGFFAARLVIGQA
ncbi:MAG: RsmB/NOP family class I SAM-dependent RNA methyltransferase [Alphaproteobacteria bacterium]